MQVLQIIQEQATIRNARELARAFNNSGDGDYQWYRIANYFYQNINPDSDRMGDDRGEIDGLMREINSRVGANMPENLSPIAWNNQAVRYGMEVNNNTPSWQEIYDHLAPHAGYDLPEKFNVEGSGSDVSRPGITQDSFRETSTWVQTDVTEWTDAEALRRDYLAPWWEILRTTHRPEFWEPGQVNNGPAGGAFLWSRDVTSSGSTNTEYSSLVRFFRQFSREMFDEEISRSPRNVVTKETVDAWLYSWLRQADTAFAGRNRGR